MGFSCAVITGALIAPYLGRYLDHGSPRKIVLYGVAIVSASYVLLAYVSNLVQFYFVVSVCMGLGMATMGGQVWHRSVMNWFDHWRGRAIAFAVMGASIAGIVMPPLVNAMIEAIDWRNAYLVFGATTALVLFPAVFFFMRDRIAHSGVPYLLDRCSDKANFPWFQRTYLLHLGPKNANAINMMR